MDAEKVDALVAANYEEFSKILPSIIGKHRNEYALIRDGRIENFYTTSKDAFVTGYRLYPDGNYSIQKVSTEKVDLGVFSHVGRIG